jgi:hypothetical protein
MLVTGRSLVLGEVCFRLFADLAVGVTLVGGGTYRKKEIKKSLAKKGM